MTTHDQARIITVNGHTPTIDPTAHVAAGVVVAGNVRVEAGASIWFNSVLRAEEGSITVGPDSNVQDGCVVHADPGFDVVIGQRVTVGHRAVVHGCCIGDDALIGMGAVVLNGADIGPAAVVGAGAVVTEGSTVASDTVVVGAPARPKAISPPPVPRANVAAYKRLATWYDEQGGQPA